MYDKYLCIDCQKKMTEDEYMAGDVCDHCFENNPGWTQ